MHGLINRAIERFVRDTYGPETWHHVVRMADLGFDEFEAMLSYDDTITHDVLAAVESVLGRPVPDIQDDIGTYLASHPKLEALRRLLRFGGRSFPEFLHSLDELPARAQLAVSDLILPELALIEHSADQFSLSCRAAHHGFGHVLVGLLRAMEDDYGALVVLEHAGQHGQTEMIDIRLSQVAYTTGRRFDLTVMPG